MEMLFLTEEEQEIYENESKLWEKDPLLVNALSIPIPTPQTNPYEELSKLSSVNKMTDSVKFIKNIQENAIPDYSKFTQDSDFDEFSKIFQLDSNLSHDFKEDYQKYKNAIYLKQSEPTAKTQAKNPTNFIDEITNLSAPTIKKPAKIQDQKKDKPETDMKIETEIKIEGNIEKTKELESWLDNVLS